MQVPDARNPPLVYNSVSVLFQCSNSSMQNFPFYPQFLHEKCLSGPPRDVTTSYVVKAPVCLKDLGRVIDKPGNWAIYEREFVN